MSEQKLDAFDKLVIEAKRRKGQYVDPNADYSVDPGKLPSRFQLGEYVSIRFGNSISVSKAKVIKVHFTVSKVQYDLEVFFSDMGTTTRLYNIDSTIVEDVI